MIEEDIKDDFHMPNMEIAWRYENQQPTSKPSLKSQLGHFYDLSKNMDKTLINQTNIHYWRGENYKQTSSGNNIIDLKLLQS